MVCVIYLTLFCMFYYINSSCNKTSNFLFLYSDKEKLQTCLKSLLYENQQLCMDAACSSLSTTRLQQRLAVLERYFSALSRQTPPEKSGPSKKSQTNQTNLNKQKWYPRLFLIQFLKLLHLICLCSITYH